MTRPGSPASAAWMASSARSSGNDGPTSGVSRTRPAATSASRAGRGLGGIAGAVDGAREHLLAVRELGRVEVEAGAGGRHADERRAPAGPHARERERRGGGRAHGLQRAVGAVRAREAPQASRSSGRSRGSHRRGRASQRRAGRGSTPPIAGRRPGGAALDTNMAHAAGADHDDDVARGDLARGADPGQRGTAEQGRLGRGQLVRELEHAARGHDDALGERAHGGHAVDRLAVGREPRRAVGQRPGADARPQRQAGGRAAGEARPALAAGGRPGEDHAIAGGQAVHVGADGLDDAGALVAEHHRPRPHPLALDDVEVGAADADGVDAHERIARPGPLEVDRADDERGARRLEERRAHPHRHGPARRQSAAAMSADGAISHSHVSA